MATTNDSGDDGQLHAAPPTPPPPGLTAYEHRPSFRSKERQLREIKRQARAALRPPPKPVAPRNPRYMRPSTSMALVRRQISAQGLPLGKTVVESMTAYHDSYCKSIDTSTPEGRMRFAMVNARYANNFWPQVPALLDATHQRHVKRRNDLTRSAGSSMYKYLKVKPKPATLQECGQTHFRDMQKLYDRVVAVSENGGGGTTGTTTTTGTGVAAYGLCPHCGDEETIRYRFHHLCPKCHRTTEDVSSCDRNFKEYETCDVRGSASYKRINHFNEWLLRTQGLEQRQVPQVVLDAVRHHLSLAGRPVTPQSPPRVVYMNVRSALVRARYQDFFEHVPQIIHKVVGLEPPKLSTDELSAVRRVFTDIQAPFDRVKPPGRRNFLSYAYVIYKTCELLEIDRILPFCPLFKSVQNQRNADAIWRKICKELNYEYIPTV